MSSTKLSPDSRILCKAYVYTEQFSIVILGVRGCGAIIDVMAFRLNYFFLTGIVAYIISSRGGLHGKAIMCKIQTFTSKWKEISVNPKEAIFINCSTILRGPAVEISWNKEGKGLASDLDLTVKGVPGLWSSLQINNVSAKDAGTYKCEVKKGNEKDDCEVSLYVNARPDIVTTEGFYTTTPQVLPVGHSPVFHCYATGWPRPSLGWFKDGREIESGDNMASYALTRRHNGLDLKILYVREREHAGQYCCVARNRFGKAHHDIFLIVQSKFPLLPPRVHSPLDRVSLERNDEALLTCVGMNTPNKGTVVSWIFNGSFLPLDSDDGYHYELDFAYFEDEYTPKVNFSLLIRNVTERDTGAYRCGVLTPKGNDSDSIYLSLVKPSSGQRKDKALLIEILLVGAAILCGLLTAVIAHRIWTRRRRLCKYDFQSKDFQFDVFISYSSLDYNWVKDCLIPVLEQNQIKYCIHCRDFIVGKAIIENIADSVYNSRKMLAVISHNYLASKFCREELEIALYRCTEMDDASLLLIRVDSIDNKNLPKTLRRRTFLDYTSTSERGDWDHRLLNHLRIKESKDATNMSADRLQLITESVVKSS